MNYVLLTLSATSFPTANTTFIWIETYRCKGKPDSIEHFKFLCKTEPTRIQILQNKEYDKCF